MRKAIFLFAPATLAVAALVACESDSPGGTPGPSFDSGLADWSAPPTTNDAGTTPDAAPDAPAVPSVSVTVLGHGGPKAGVRIVFHDAAGAVMETKLTGSDGKATHTGETPAMASALLAFEDSRRIVTWTGVENGDDLQVLEREEDEPLGLYSVTLPGASPDNADIYDVENPCSRTQSYGTAAQLPLYRNCTRPQNAARATARPFQGDLIAYAFKKGNPAITDGGTGSITLGAWTTPTPFAVNVTNAPVEDSFQTSLLEIADGAGFRNRWANFQGATVTYPIAPGFADAYQASVALEVNGRDRRLAKRVAPGAANVSLDFDTLLPEIDEVDLVTSNPQRPVVSWVTAAPLTATDGGLVHVRFSGPQERTYAWTFVVPGSATTVTAPAMPAEADEFLPPAPDSGAQASFRIPRVIFVEGDAIPSYAAFRRQQGLFLDHTSSFNGAELPVLPANGSYRTTSWDMIPR